MTPWCPGFLPKSVSNFILTETKTGGIKNSEVFVAEAIFCQIFIVLVLMRKTKKKIIKIGALLTKWEQFLFSWTSCQVQSPEMSITHLEPYNRPPNFSQLTQNGQISWLNVYHFGPYGKLLGTYLVLVKVFEYSPTQKWEFYCWT